MWLLTSCGMFCSCFLGHTEYKIVLNYCSLSEVDSVGYAQFWNVLLLFSGVILSIRSFLTIAVYLR